MGSANIGATFLPYSKSVLTTDTLSSFYMGWSEGKSPSILLYSPRSSTARSYCIFFHIFCAAARCVLVAGVSPDSRCKISLTAP